MGGVCGGKLIYAGVHLRQRSQGPVIRGRSLRFATRIFEAYQPLFLHTRATVNSMKYLYTNNAIRICAFAHQVGMGNWLPVIGQVYMDVTYFHSLRMWYHGHQ